MRKIERIVVHCSGGPGRQKASQIVNYHTRPVSKGGRGWRNPGYHYIIEEDGICVATLPESEIANGAKGWNGTSIHICYTGGIGLDGKPADTRTASQKSTLRRLAGELRRKYGGIPVLGHRDLSPDRNGDGRITRDEWIKACPCFEAKELLQGREGQDKD